MKTYQAEFVISAVQREQWPGSDLPEIVFAGRSNAGKSTLINALINRKNLAYTGKTPGKTRMLNFYTVDNRLMFVDAPGYGFAKADAMSAKDFGRLMEPYFRYREPLRALVLVLDIRRTPSDEDLQMVTYARENRIAVIPVLNKCDKVKQQEKSMQTRKASEILSIPVSAFIPVSAQRKENTDAVWMEIERIAKQ